MFRILFGIAAIMLCLGVFYIYLVLGRMERFYREKFGKRNEVPQKKKFGKTFIRIILTVLLVVFCIRVWNGGMIFLLYLIGFWAVMDILNFLLKRVFKGTCLLRWRILYGSGILPLIAAAGMIIYGMWNIDRIVQTDYIVETEKGIREEGYKVALITDIHYGTIQDEELLKDAIQRINAENPDFVILGGDIVEEGTSKEKMQEVFSLLGTLEAEMGIYYVYGNHDKQLYSSNRAYSEQELSTAIERNGIQILEDEVVAFNNELLLVGRVDASLANRQGRRAMSAILSEQENLEAGKIDIEETFILVADHQPVGAEENNKAGVDLQVSGHTHAGQFWPGVYLLNMTGELAYGEYQVGDCTVLVSSGVCGWGYPLRTSKHCEYVMIHIQNK